MKIAVGLSGGVDSSVAALLLKRAGYDVIALFMQNWHDTEGTLHGDCEWEEDRKVAEMVARKLDIPFHFVDLSGIYRERVVDYMFSEYEKGRTPNPDVLCNREIKFDAFLKCALELGADRVATGHYCRKEKFTGADGRTIYRILAGDDKNKDQSYFLCQLSQDQLKRAWFPIGGLDKPQVRRLAREAGLPSADKKDSQGICFVGKVDLPVFLQQQLKPREGKVVEIFAADYPAIAARNAENPGPLHPDSAREGRSGNAPEAGMAGMTGMTGPAVPAEVTGTEGVAENYTAEELARLAEPVRYEESDGKVIGTHQGAQFYTIGQRRGLNIGGHKESLFIISMDIEKNIIYVGEGQSHPGLYRKGLRIEPQEIHWIRPDLEMTVGERRPCRVRIRYRQPLQDAVLFRREEGMFIVFDRPQRGITPGQFAVWYTPEEEMTGSGVISR